MLEFLEQNDQQIRLKVKLTCWYSRLPIAIFRPVFGIELDDWFLSTAIVNMDQVIMAHSTAAFFGNPRSCLLVGSFVTILYRNSFLTIA
jgi:hypothetical protein